jgi:hypothetical protein
MWPWRWVDVAMDVGVDVAVEVGGSAKFSSATDLAVQNLAVYGVEGSIAVEWCRLVEWWTGAESLKAVD